ncbi:MAG: hypothetical protein NVS9B4_06960 [Candidatus Acidiferrum sp.]
MPAPQRALCEALEWLYLRVVALLLRLTASRLCYREAEENHAQWLNALYWLD